MYDVFLLWFTYIIVLVNINGVTIQIPTKTTVFNLFSKQIRWSNNIQFLKQNVVLYRYMQDSCYNSATVVPCWCIVVNYYKQDIIIRIRQHQKTTTILSGVTLNILQNIHQRIWYLILYHKKWLIVFFLKSYYIINFHIKSLIVFSHLRQLITGRPRAHYP